MGGSEPQSHANRNALWREEHARVQTDGRRPDGALVH
jgi:hypothetical protein